PPGGCAPAHPPACAAPAPGTPTRHRRHTRVGEGRHLCSSCSTILSSARPQPSTQTAAPAAPAGAVCSCRALGLTGDLAPLGHERIHIGNLVLAPVALEDPVGDLGHHLVVIAIHRVIDPASQLPCLRLIH